MPLVELYMKPTANYGEVYMVAIPATTAGKPCNPMSWCVDPETASATPKEAAEKYFRRCATDPLNYIGVQEPRYVVKFKLGAVSAEVWVPKFDSNGNPIPNPTTGTKVDTRVEGELA
jgi:hypothetical protein